MNLPEPPGNDAAPTTSHVRHPQSAYGPPPMLYRTNPTPPQSTLSIRPALGLRERQAPAVCDHLDQARADVRSRASSPPGYGPRFGSNNPTRPTAKCTTCGDFPKPLGHPPGRSRPRRTKTTNGPKPTPPSAPTSSPNHDSHPNPPSRRNPINQRITHPEGHKTITIHSTGLDLEIPASQSSSHSSGNGAYGNRCSPAGLDQKIETPDTAAGLEC